MEHKDRLECMLKEAEIIQDVIKRMGFNSFLIKGWTITLVVATLLVKGTLYQVLIAFIPLVVFWFLDAYYLWQERMYRELHNWVAKNRLTTDEHLFDMDASRFKDQVAPKWRVLFSTTLIWFYGSIAFLIAIYCGFLLFIM